MRITPPRASADQSVPSGSARIHSGRCSSRPMLLIWERSTCQWRSGLSCLLIRRCLERLASEPGAPASIQRLDSGSFESRHIFFNRVADRGLQISEMPIALRKLLQQFRIERERRSRTDETEPIFLVNRLAQHHSPSSGSTLDEIVEAAGAHHIAKYLVHFGTLRDAHLGLRDRAIAGQVDGTATKEVQDADSLVPALDGDPNELLCTALEPSGHHVSIIVPDGAKARPVASIAPQHPVFDQLANFAPINHRRIHGEALRGLTAPAGPITIMFSL